jgi:hypothetical protein
VARYLISRCLRELFTAWSWRQSERASGACAGDLRGPGIHAPAAAHSGACSSFAANVPGLSGLADARTARALGLREAASNAVDQWQPGREAADRRRRRKWQCAGLSVTGTGSSSISRVSPLQPPHGGVRVAGGPWGGGWWSRQPQRAVDRSERGAGQFTAVALPCAPAFAAAGGPPAPLP